MIVGRIFIEKDPIKSSSDKRNHGETIFSDLNSILTENHILKQKFTKFVELFAENVKSKS